MHAYRVFNNNSIINNTTFIREVGKIILPNKLIHVQGFAMFENVLNVLYVQN